MELDIRDGTCDCASSVGLAGAVSIGDDEAGIAIFTSSEPDELDLVEPSRFTGLGVLADNDAFLSCDVIDQDLESLGVRVE
jgi:hypothetical protein